MSLFLVFIVGMSVTMVLIPPLARLAGRLHLLDQPSGRKLHAQPVPRVGGVAIIVAAVLPVLVWLQIVPQVEGFLAAAAAIFVFGVWDDLVELRWPVKLAGQLLAVFLVMYFGEMRIGSWTPEARELLPDWISLPLTFFFLLGITNAINLADGLDGLAGGTTLLSLCALALLAYTGADFLVCTLAVAIAGAIFGFLRFNTHPARVFMGDSGSQFLGLGVGVLAVMATQNPQNPVSAALPLLLLGLPILDTLAVMTQRLLEGRSPFAADKNHIHHKLLALGFEHHEAVVAIYLLQCLLFLAAYFLRFESDLMIVLLFALFAVSLIALLHQAQLRGWRWRHGSAAAHKSLIARQIQWLRSPERLPRWALLFICVCLPAYGLFVISRATAVSEDLALLALALLAASALTLPWMWGRDPGWLERGVVYVAAVSIVYLDQTGDGASNGWGLAFFAVLAAAIVIRFRFSGEGRFEVTPLDVLVIFIALVVPNLPGSVQVQLPPGLAHGMGKIIVLLYAIETVLAARLRWNLPRAVVGGVLVLLAVRGLVLPES